MTTVDTRPLLVSMGDPDGIGPEIIAKAWHARIAQALPCFAVAGDIRHLSRLAPTASMDGLAGAQDAFAQALPVLNVEGDTAAALAFSSLELATSLVVSGAGRGLVTGPVAKSRLYLGGFRWPGQTEYVAEKCGIDTDRAVMMLAGEDLRTVPLTIHIPLKDVPSALTREKMSRKIRVVDQALRADFGIPAPRLVLAGLNPHAGESGTLGREDTELLAPLVAELRAEGLDIRGPLSADTLFHAQARSGYDAALCCYHDQALIPVKTLYFDSGVNVTLGLPIIRTAPDHGTAFDIAGKNMANPSAMIAAIRLAAQIAGYRHA